MKKNNIADDITKIMFNGATNMIRSKLDKTPCTYFNFNEKYHEPTKLMKLRIFEHNTSIFINNFKGIKGLNNCSCLKYVYECVNIYKKMHRDYCLAGKQFEPLNKATCNILNNFETSYLAYLFDARGINDKLPLLDGTNNEEIPRCLSDESKLASAEDPFQSAEANSSGTEQSKSPISNSTSAIVSTMVGIPPFLALIYKVKIFLLKIQTTVKRNS
ncbi:hypothetical protein PVIIG_06094 [Plasmodium vivax India VII]|uniref:Uncharacterized protein n=1 Tax=Plasmodium vivax India VII TaxID=1077284 RepID=A0A0J9S4Z1_PLAVI|nr:hypothetical protein PVIIG_06094 [Plasmodium vivax India VII]